MFHFPYFKIHEGKDEEWYDNAKTLYERTKTDNDVIHLEFLYTDDGQVHRRKVWL